jgi:hypothetical protein
MEDLLDKLNLKDKNILFQWICIGLNNIRIAGKIPN